jgi:phosphoribosylamine-glycine ligase
MARLEDELLVPVRVEHGEVVVVDDAMARHAIDERGVRKLEEDLVAGTKLVDVKLVTDGGRVLSVTALGETIAAA